MGFQCLEAREEWEVESGMGRGTRGGVLMRMAVAENQRQICKVVDPSRPEGVACLKGAKGATRSPATTAPVTAKLVRVVLKNS